MIHHELCFLIPRSNRILKVMDHPHFDLQLPVEITDMIIDFLFDDTHALATMSLACKAFLSSTRRHLFNTVTLRADYPHRGEPARARLEELKLISVSLAPVVRRLNIVMAYVFGGHHEAKQLNEWIAAAMPLFLVIRGITCLSIRSAAWLDIEPEVRNGLFGSFPQLSELSLHDGHFFDHAQVVDSILQCPTIERLRILDFSVENESFEAVSPLLGLQTLQSLEIGGQYVTFNPIINWILSMDTTPFLHTLRITCIYPDECESIAQFICALGPSLRHLTLWFMDGV
jgi:hypothetical protein